MNPTRVLLCLAAVLFLASAANAYGSASIVCSNNVPFTLRWDTAGVTGKTQFVSLSTTVPSYVPGSILCSLSSLPAAFHNNNGTRTFGHGTSVNTYGSVGTAFFHKTAAGVYSVSLYSDTTTGQGSGFQSGTKINDSFTWISA